MSSDSERELFGDAEDRMDASDVGEDEAREPVHHRALLKRYAPSHHTSTAWLSRIPAFLNLEPQPFDATKFAASDKSPDDIALESNTVRWKYAAAENASEQKVTRVSNARIVEWSDGSRTLQLGNEHFEIKTHTQGDPAFVCTEQEDEQLLATRNVVNDTMSFLPTSTSSATHIMLARALQRKQEIGQVRVGSVNTTEDPDRVQREIERAEQAKEKARRKLAAQRDEIVSYTDRTASAGNEMDVDEDDDEEPAEDDDEEEEEAEETGDEQSDDDERANRLNQIKHREDDDAPVQRRRVLDDEDSD